MDIKILGTGCVNCKNLGTLTRDVLAEGGVPKAQTATVDPSDDHPVGVG